MAGSCWSTSRRLEGKSAETMIGSNARTGPRRSRRQLGANERTKVRRRSKHLLVEPDMADVGASRSPHYRDGLAKGKVRPGVEQDHPQQVVRGANLRVAELRLDLLVLVSKLPILVGRHTDASKRELLTGMGVRGIAVNGSRREELTPRERSGPADPCKTGISSTAPASAYGKAQARRRAVAGSELDAFRASLPRKLLVAARPASSDGGRGRSVVA